MMGESERRMREEKTGSVSMMRCGLRFILSSLFTRFPPPHHSPHTLLPLPLLGIPAPTEPGPDQLQLHHEPRGFFPDSKPYCGQNATNPSYSVTVYICDSNTV